MARLLRFVCILLCLQANAGRKSAIKRTIKKPCVSAIRNNALAQQDYMVNIHVADAEASKEQFEKTLYQPLRRHFQIVLDASNISEKVHLAYIGAGPMTPLFSDPAFRQQLLAKIDTVTLVDVSPVVLELAKEQLQALAPQLTIHTRVADITANAATEFKNSIDSLINKISRAKTPAGVRQVFAQLRSLEGYKIKPSKSASAVKADIVYSEMVATFTGTAAMVSIEEAIAAKKIENPALAKELEQGLVQLRKYWQAYNDMAYPIQVQEMSHLGSGRALLTLATDVQKKFDNATIPAILSFTSMDFPSTLQKERPISFDDEVWWDDSHRSDDSENDPGQIEALQPHRHRILFRTYQNYGH